MLNGLHSSRGQALVLHQPVRGRLSRPQPGADLRKASRPRVWSFDMLKHDYGVSPPQRWTASGDCSVLVTTSTAITPTGVDDHSTSTSSPRRAIDRLLQ